MAVFLVHALVLNLVIVGAAAACAVRNGDLLAEMVRLSTNGFWLCLAMVPAVPAALLFLWAVVRLRRGPSPKDSFALYPAPWRTYLAWNAVLLLFLGAVTALNHCVDRPVPDWMLQVYESAGSLPLLVLAIVCLGPLFEEMLFRGFLFRSWLPTRLGEAGTVLITSLLWTAIHVQYAPFELAQVFAAGLLLGAARVRSRSVFVPLSMHALMNFAALAELILLQPGT